MTTPGTASTSDARKRKAERETEQPPPCPNHREVQHRDRKPPWCPDCGWNRGRPAVPARQIEVPLVWQHNHDNPLNILGHAVLEHRGSDHPDGAGISFVLADREAPVTPPSSTRRISDVQEDHEVRQPRR